MHVLNTKLNTTNCVFARSFSIIALCWCSLATAVEINKNEPWFTGPLLAQQAVTIKPGQLNIEIFNFTQASRAVYDNQTKLVAVEANTTNQLIPQITYGLTSDVDLEFQPVLITNHFKDRSYTSIGDTTLIMGVQVLNQKENSFQPDLRTTLTQILPSGHYQGFSQQNYALNATGMGSYQTGLDFNFQKTIHMQGEHFLNAHLSFGYLYASSVNITGINSYGGAFNTKGDIKPGSVYTLDLAGELSLTQHWVALLEGFFQYQDSDRFQGSYGDIGLQSVRLNKKQFKEMLSRLYPTQHNISSLFQLLPKIGNASSDMLTLAPALEYNFSSNFGVIIGSWFTIYGKNTPEFTTLTVGINLLL